jgi:uncharacterized membrane protein
MKFESPLPEFLPTERLGTFSDGVFAVVITILVLGIEIPSDSATTAAELLALRDKFLHQILIYFVSFWLIALYWSQHHLLFSSVKQIDRPLVVLNLWFLLPATLLPFVTQLMGTFRDEWRPVLLFGVTNLWAAFMFERMAANVAAQPELHKSTATASFARRSKLGARFFGVVMIVGVLLALVDVKAGTALFLVMPIVYFYGFIRDPFAAGSGSTSAK